MRRKWAGGLMAGEHSRRMSLGTGSPRGRSRVAVALTAGLVAAGQALSVGRAGAALTAVACGQTVTTDVVLESDVGPCPGAGLVVIGTGITVDLNGHSVTGPSSLDNRNAGIRVVNSVGVTVRNGTVTGFMTGIELNGANRGIVTRMRVVGNVGALDVFGTDHSGAGIEVGHSHDNVLTENRIVGNGSTAGVWIVLSSGNRVERNVVQANAVRAPVRSHFPGGVVQVDSGIVIEGTNSPWRGDAVDRRDNNTIRSNQIVGNGLHGIRVEGFTTGNVIAGNQVVGNGWDQPANLRILPYGDGIHVNALGNVIEGNSVARNGGNGIAVHQPQNQVRRNTTIGNSQRPNASATFDLTDSRACAGNVWSQNAFGTFSHPCVTA